MRMRNIALAGMALIILTTFGCSKKSEDQPMDKEMAPASTSQESSPAPMQNQNMEQGTNSETSTPSDTESQPMDAPENDSGDGEDSQGAHDSSGM